MADIPLEPEHVSAATLDGIAEEIRKLDDVPVLLLWGPRDPVFSDRYLRDLRARLPHADVQRYERASHLVLEDAPEAAADAWAWISDVAGPDERPVRRIGSDDRAARPAGDDPQGADPTLWAALEARAGDPSPAVVEPGVRSISWDLLVRRVHELAVGLADHGVSPGDRVALLVPPGADLTAAAHACWRAGASVVVADPGLGAAGLARALRGAHPAHVVGALPGLTLAAALGIPGSRIAAGPVPPGLLGSPVTLAALARRGRALLDSGTALPAEAGPDDEAAVLFTSGATGPAKGVVYRHRQARRADRGPARGVRDHRRRPAGRGLPAVRALRPGAGHPVGRPGGAQARRPDRRRAGPRRRRGRRDDGLRLARSTPQRRRHRRRSRPGSARRPGRRPPRRVRRCAGARRAAPRAARRPAERGGAHPVRDDRGPARHRRRARRDRRRRPRQRGVRRARASRRRRRGGAPVAAGCSGRRADPRARDHGRDQRRRRRT